MKNKSLIFAMVVSTSLVVGGIAAAMDHPQDDEWGEMMIEEDERSSENEVEIDLSAQKRMSSEQLVQLVSRIIENHPLTEVLNLSETQIADDGVMALLPLLPQLQQLLIVNTGISLDCVAKIQADRPALMVVRAMPEVMLSVQT